VGSHWPSVGCYSGGRMGEPCICVSGPIGSSNSSSHVKGHLDGVNKLKFLNSPQIDVLPQSTIDELELAVDCRALGLA
jgi:hypothetical protein